MTDKSRIELAREIWKNSGPIPPNSPVALYLTNRNCFTILNQQESRFHENLKHPSGKSYPALINPITDGYGQIQGIQRIYLTKDGHKAPVENPKLSLGEIKGNSIKLGIHHGQPVLSLCEGFETAMSLYKVLKQPIWAVGGAYNLSQQTIPPFVHTVILWVDVEKSEAGMKEAYKAAEIYQSQFKDVGIMIPQEAPYV